MTEEPAAGTLGGMTHRRLLAALAAAAALLPATASAMPPDLHGIHHRATTADVDRPAPSPHHSDFPWLETATLAGLVVAAGAETARRRRRTTAVT